MFCFSVIQYGDGTVLLGFDGCLFQAAVLPLYVYLIAPTGAQTLYLAVGPLGGQGGTKFDGSCAVGVELALQQHLAHTSRTAEVTVNLEGWMGIEQVWIGAASRPATVGAAVFVGTDILQQLLQDLEGLVGAMEACPKVDAPAGAPSSRLVALLNEGLFAGFEEGCNDAAS